MTIKFLMVYFVGLVCSLNLGCNPFTMTLNLLMMSFLVSISGMNLMNKWVGFSLLLFYLGGMMILFIYLVSMVIIEKLVFSFNMMAFFTFSSVVSLFWVYLPWFPVQEVWEVSSIYFISALMIPLVTMILLLALLAVVLITGASKGPLKSLAHA